MKKFLSSGLLAFFAIATSAQTTIYSTTFGTAACALPAGWSIENDGSGDEITITDISPSGGGFSGGGGGFDGGGASDSW